MIFRRNVVYDAKEDTPLFRIHNPSDYSFFLKEQDALRYACLNKFLLEGGVNPHFGGSAAKNYLDSHGNRSDYNDVDILGVIPGKLEDASAFTDLRRLFNAGTTQTNPVQIENCAFNVTYHPIVGGYMSIHTGIRRELFDMGAVQTIEEIKANTRVVPVHLVFISEKDFKKNLKRVRSRSK